MMKHVMVRIALGGLLLTIPANAICQENEMAASKAKTEVVQDNANDTTALGMEFDDVSDNNLDTAANDDLQLEDEEDYGIHQTLKSKFIEGNAGFMSLVALVLVLGLALCIERIIYLTLSEINSKKLMKEIEDCIMAENREEAMTLCRNTRGPVASICYQGLLRMDESMESIERSIVSYGAVQSANMERGCSWITLFIAMAPSLGFLGTVIGMVMAFDQIQTAEDISPAIVAAGMKVALITTIFGIIVALILQVFYNFILSKIEHLTNQMEESAITLLDIIMKKKLKDN